MNPKERFLDGAKKPISYWESYIDEIKLNMKYYPYISSLPLKCIRWAQAIIDYKKTGVLNEEDWFDGDYFRHRDYGK